MGKGGLATLCASINEGGCDADENHIKVLVAEIIATFLFVSVNVNIIYDNGSKEIIMNALVIGLALATCVAIAAPVSGASVNPAVGLIQPIFQHLVNDVPLS